MKIAEDADQDGAASSSDDSESALQPREATPTAIDGSAFPEGTIFVQVAASDNATFALTDEGLVYGREPFKVSEQSSLRTGNFNDH